MCYHSDLSKTPFTRRGFLFEERSYEQKMLPAELWHLLALYLDHNACEQLERVNRRMHMLFTNDLWWKRKFAQYNQHDDLPITFREAYYHLQFKLFRRERDTHNIPIVVRYITRDVIIDIFNRAYFITYDKVVHHLSIIGQMTTCVYSVQHPNEFHVTYINDKKELWNLMVDNAERCDRFQRYDHGYSNTLIKSNVRCATYEAQAAMVVVDTSNQMSIFISSYTNSYSDVMRDICHQPWYNGVISFSSPITSLAVCDLINRIFVLTEDRRCYEMECWLFRRNNDMVRSIREIHENVGCVLSYDHVVFAIVGNKIEIIAAHGHRRVDQKLSFQKIHYINGCPMITYEDKIYSFHDLCLLMISERYSHYYLSK